MKLKKLTICFSLISAIPTLPAQGMPLKNREDSLSNQSRQKEERNVMLNASDANKPREIQIGLPSEDVNVYENGLPAVFSSRTTGWT